MKRTINRLDAMRIFVRVAELSSFTRAAETLGLPKASMSAAVQKLEKLVGARLLHRTTRRVQLTQDGRTFYERCKDLLADMDELQSMFQQSPQSLRGRLRVDMPSSAARDMVIPRLPEFLREHPHLELELSSTDRKVDLVREGFDCVLRVGAVQDPSVVARQLGRFRMINCASPAYLARYGVPRTLEDLAHHQLVHYVPTLGARSTGWEYFDGAKYRNLDMPGAITVNNVEAYEAACLAGLGLADFPSEPMPVALLYAHRRNLSQRLKAFMNWMAQILAPYLDP
jgi:DNA-binding transcriptional LysR family regulator